MSLTERRRPAITAELLVRTGLVWLIVSAILLISNWHAINTMALHPPNLAETSMMVVAPLAALGAAMLLAARLAWRMFDSELIFYAALILPLAAPATGQLQALQSANHGWQIVVVLAAINALSARSARIGGWVAGSVLGFGLMVSPDLLAITLLLSGVLGLRWLAQTESRGWLVHFLQALALTSLAGLVLGGCDAAPAAHVAALGSAALGTNLLALTPRMPRLPLLLALGVITAAALAAGLMLGPQCAASGPSFARFSFNGALPVWAYRPEMIVQMVVPPLIGLIAALRLCGQSHGWLARFWLEYTGILAGAVLISLFNAPASGIACALAAVPLAWQTRRWLRAAQAMRRPVQRIPAFAAMALAVVPALPLMALASLAAGLR